MTVLPNLFVIGASKCGTTFFHDLLSQHPDIFMARAKELWHFNRLDHEKRTNKYLASFQEGAGCAIRGESTPIYCETLAFPHIPAAMGRFNPNAKLIYLVREPFSRLESVWAQTRSTGHWAEKKFYSTRMPLSFRQAVFAYPTFLDACRYWTSLNHFRRFFPDDQIKVILFEHFIENVQGTMSGVFNFLEVDADFSVEPNLQKSNSRTDGKTVYGPLTRKLVERLPGVAKRILPVHLRHGIRNWISRLTAPQFDEQGLSQLEVEIVRRELGPELVELFSYMNLRDDPWHFLPKGGRDLLSEQVRS